MKWGIIGSSERDRQEDLNILTTPKWRGLIKPLDVIISGGHPVGGDLFAELVAKDWGRTIIIYQPLWELTKEVATVNGVKRRLGPTSARNKRIADNSDKILAFVNGVRVGGTEETIRFFLGRLKLTEAQAIEQEKLFLL